MLLRLAVVAAAGLACGAGIVIAGLLDSGRTRAFFDLAHATAFGWDDRLLAVAATAQLVGLVGIRLAQKRSRRPPIDAPADEIDTADSDHADRRLVWGALLFGAGLGLAGVGPAIAVAGLGVAPLKAFAAVTASMLGMRVADSILQRLGPQARPDKRAARS